MQSLSGFRVMPIRPRPDTIRKVSFCPLQSGTSKDAEAATPQGGSEGDRGLVPTCRGIIPPDGAWGKAPYCLSPNKFPFHHNTTEHEAAPHPRSGTMGVRGRLSPPAGFRGRAPVPFLPFLRFLSSAFTPFRAGRRLRTRTGWRVWRRGRAGPRGGGIRHPFWR